MRNLIRSTLDTVRSFFKRHFHNKNESLPYYIVILIAAILFSLAVKVFAEVTDELAENELQEFDTSISEYVVSFRSPSLTTFFTFMTHMGDRYGYFIISILIGAYYFFKHKSWKFIAQTVLVLLLATVSNVLVKRVINRARPSVEHLVEVNDLSFPSGHSMSAMAFYGFLIYLVSQTKIKIAFRVVISVLLIVTIFSIGISRIYLGVHYPSDVVAGFAGGLIWVTLCVIIFNVIDLWRKRQSLNGQ